MCVRVCVRNCMYMKHIVISVINDFQTNWCPLSVNLFLGSRYYGTCLYLRTHCDAQVSYNDVCMWFIVGIFNKRSEHTLPRRAVRTAYQAYITTQILNVIWISPRILVERAITQWKKKYGWHSFCLSKALTNRCGIPLP